MLGATKHARLILVCARTSGTSRAGGEPLDLLVRFKLSPPSTIIPRDFRSSASRS